MIGYVSMFYKVVRGGHVNICCAELNSGLPRVVVLLFVLTVVGRDACVYHYATRISTTARCTMCATL